MCFSSLRFTVVLDLCVCNNFISYTMQYFSIFSFQSYSCFIQRYLFRNVLRVICKPLPQYTVQLMNDGLCRFLNNFKNINNWLTILISETIVSLTNIYIYLIPNICFSATHFQSPSRKVNIIMLSSTKTRHIDQRILFLILDFVKYWIWTQRKFW